MTESLPSSCRKEQFTKIPLYRVNIIHFNLRRCAGIRYDPVENSMSLCEMSSDLVHNSNFPPLFQPRCIL